MAGTINDDTNNAFNAGLADAQETQKPDNCAYQGDWYTKMYCGRAYARGWLKGHASHSNDIARLIASAHIDPTDEDYQ